MDSLASGRPTELRSYVAERASLGMSRRWKAWMFDVPAIAVVRAEAVAEEFSVTKQVLVTLVVDCLTQGFGDDGGKRTTLEELLRIIYSSAPFSAPTAAGGLRPAEVVATSTA